MVGHGKRWHFKFVCPPEKIIKPYGAIEQAVLGVHVQVDKFRVLHTMNQK
jgi:hypothetical protein